MLTKSRFILPFTLLPILIDLGLIAYGLVSNKSDIAFLALWGILIAIPACIFNFAISSKSFAIYDITPGSKKIKLLAALAFFVSCYAAIYVVFLRTKLGEDDNRVKVKIESSRAGDFVKNNKVVTDVVGIDAKTNVVAVRSESGSLPIEYEIMVEGVTTTYAIVTIAMESGQRTFKLKCITPIYFGHRDSHIAPCKE